MPMARLIRRTFPIAAVLLAAAARAAVPACLQQPAVSPDGREVAFVAAGGIWTVPTAGGDARPLVANLGDVLRPRYSPDGKRIAFVSNRTGNGDLYVLTLDTGELKRVTVDESPDRLDDWSPDGRFLYYSTGGHEVGATSDIYRVAIDGGTPMPVVAEPYGGDFYAAPAPDGHTVAFCGGGSMAAGQWWRHGHAHIDCCAIWTTGDGKAFVRRTDDLSKHLWPMWSPDGHTLYCMSDADGNENLCAVPIDQPTSRPTATQPLTRFHDGRLLWPTISADGSTIVFERDFGIWKLDVRSGTASPIDVRLRGVIATPAAPQRQTYTRDASELAVSHDGRKLAVVVRGQVFAAPTVPGDSPQPAFRVTHTDAIEAAVAWSNDDRRLVYVSTRDGWRHVYLYDFATRTETRLTDANANDSSPAFAPDDSAVAFVRNGRELRAVELTVTRRRRRLATRATTKPSTTRAAMPAIDGSSGDWSRLADDELDDLRTQRGELAKTQVDPVNQPLLDELRRVVDTKIVALQRTLGATEAADADGGGPTSSPSLTANVVATQPSGAYRDHLIADGLSLPQPPFGGRRTLAWAPAGDYIAVASAGAKGFRNVYLVPAAGGAPRQISYLANADSTAPAWTADGSSILFGSGQRTEDTDLARVDLKPRTPSFRTDQFSDLFRQRPSRQTPEPSTPRQPSGDDDDDIVAGPATTRATTAVASLFPTTAPSTDPTTRPNHTEVVFDDIDQRLALLPVGLDVAEVAASPDGKWAGIIGTAGGRTNVYLYPLDPLVESPVARQMTATADGKSDLQFAAEPGGGGTRLYFREGGRPRYVPVPFRATGSSTGGGEVGEVPVSVEMDASFDRDKRVAFDQAWRYLADQFHDPAMHGLDWPAVRARFLPHLEAARTPADERRVLSLMIGELNSSHMAITAPRDDEGHGNVARLGVAWDAAEYDRTGRLRVASVIPFGPAALAGITAGQFVVSVDGTSTDRPANVDALLENKAGKDVSLAVSDGSSTAPHAARVMTVGPATERTLAYRAWVHANRQYVAKASGNRLGYIHIADMGEQALTRLSADLDARNETYDGVVVDVRNNTGGFVNGFAIDVFARRNYINLQARGAGRIAGRTALGQRFLGLPTVLVTNRETLSDGESFTEGYQALGLGDTVGEPTAGWIIFTSGVTLLDGTGIRLPSDSVYDHAGQEMEMHPRPVTTFVQRPVGEASAGRDSQLDAAVKDLLGKLK
jgi:tricorn protease